MLAPSNVSALHSFPPYDKQSARMVYRVVRLLCHTAMSTATGGRLSATPTPYLLL